VANIERSCEFYSSILGFEVVTFGAGRKALKFGHQKFNLHQVGHEFEPKALRPTAGSADLCLIATTCIDEVLQTLTELGVYVEDGPVDRTGAQGPIRSVYIRDPDQNLIEISNYLY
jgi:catechol 2,3-dioxygenase-like lactoylglutathione lyase family enzyme